MDQVRQALAFQREYVPVGAEFNVSSVSDCSDSLARLRNDKREAREQREMTWEDHVATVIRDDALRTAAAKAKKLAQETALLAQLKSDTDKWNMAIDLRLLEYLRTTLGGAELSTRQTHLLSRNGTGQTPLHRAVKAKDPRLVELLLSMDADLSKQDDAGRSVFHLAAEMGQTEIFRVLLKRSMSQTPQQPVAVLLTQVDATGASLLHVACQHGNHDILSMVLSSLDFIALVSILNRQTTKDGATALHLASHYGHEQCLKLLMATRGLRIDLLDTRGATALHAVLRQTFNIDRLFQVFLDSLVGPASSSPSSTIESDGTNDTLDCLEEYSGHTCLHMAILKSFTDVAIKLIKSKRVALNTATRDGGWSALHLAVMTEELRTVQALVDGGAMVDSVDADGQTPLLQASLGGQLAVVRALLAGGANPAHQNKQGHSALHYLAAFCRDRALLEELITRGADVSAKSLKLNTPLHFAAMHGNEVATQVLLEHGASASAINEDKRSVVYLAKKWRHRAVEDLVKPPEEKDDTTGGSTLAGGSHSSHGSRQSPAFGAANAHGRRAAPFTTSSSAGMHATVTGNSSSSHGSRSRTPMTTRSEDSDSDADSLYSVDEDDEMILAPSTPWPTMVARTPSRGNNGNGHGNTNGDSTRPQRQLCRSFGELRERFMATASAESPSTVGAAGTGRRPLKPVVVAHRNERHAAELQAARELMDLPAPALTDAQLTRFTRKLLTGPVHIPWEMTVPTLEQALTNSSDSGLQRKLKPSIRTNIGLLRDHLTHAQHLNWPRYAHQRVFRKDDHLP